MKMHNVCMSISVPSRNFLCVGKIIIGIFNTDIPYVYVVTFDPAHQTLPRVAT